MDDADTEAEAAAGAGAGPGTETVSAEDETMLDALAESLALAGTLLLSAAIVGDPSRTSLNLVLVLGFSLVLGGYAPWPGLFFGDTPRPLR